MVLVLKSGATKEEMQAIKRKLAKQSKRRGTGADLAKFVGIIKLNEDPLLIQKRMRDEWS